MSTQNRNYPTRMHEVLGLDLADRIDGELVGRTHD